MTGQELFQPVAVYQRGILHELDPSGSWCMMCHENVDYLLESGGEPRY